MHCNEVVQVLRPCVDNFTIMTIYLMALHNMSSSVHCIATARPTNKQVPEQAGFDPVRCPGVLHPVVDCLDLFRLVVEGCFSWKLMVETSNKAASLLQCQYSYVYKADIGGMIALKYIFGRAYSYGTVGSSVW